VTSSARFKRKITSFYSVSRIARFAGGERALHQRVRDLLAYLKAVCNGWVQIKALKSLKRNVPLLEEMPVHFLSLRKL